MEIATAIGYRDFGADRISDPKTTAVAGEVDPAKSAKEAKMLLLYELPSWDPKAFTALLEKPNIQAQRMKTVELEGTLAHQTADMLENWFRALFRTESDSRTVSHVATEIEEFAGLSSDWDGHGANPISPEAVAHAVQFVRSVPQYADLFDPFPDPNGNVGLEVRIEGKVLYLNFAPNGGIAYLLRAGKEINRDRGAAPDTIRALLDVLL